jgi:phosphoribosylanthranilate isomerase
MDFCSGREKSRFLTAAARRFGMTKSQLGTQNWPLATAFMTWIKICGMTNLEDALVAVDAGADAVGFVFYEKSPRYVSVETAREICSGLPDSVEKVGVFVDCSVGEADRILRHARLSAVQIYTDAIGEWLAWHQTSERKLLIALPAHVVVGDYLIPLGSGPQKKVFAFVVDSGSGERPGGTGQPFDWEASKSVISLLEQEVPVVVAGGLTPKNVSEAIKTLRPWGVDVASGVEAEPGKKDPKKVRAFVRAVRETDRRVV